MRYYALLLFYLGVDIGNIVSISIFLYSQQKLSIFNVDIIDVDDIVSICIYALRNQLHWTFVQDLSILFVDIDDIDIILQ